MKTSQWVKDNRGEIIFVVAVLTLTIFLMMIFDMNL